MECTFALSYSKCTCWKYIDGKKGQASFYLMSLALRGFSWWDICTTKPLGKSAKRTHLLAKRSDLQMSQRLPSITSSTKMFSTDSFTVGLMCPHPILIMGNGIGLWTSSHSAGIQLHGPKVVIWMWWLTKPAKYCSWPNMWKNNSSQDCWSVKYSWPRPNLAIKIFISGTGSRTGSYRIPFKSQYSLSNCSLSRSPRVGEGNFVALRSQRRATELLLNQHLKKDRKKSCNILWFEYYIMSYVLIRSILETGTW